MMMCSMLRRLVWSKRIRTNSRRFGGTWFLFVTMPQVMSAAPTLPPTIQVNGPSPRTPRKPLPGSGGAASSARLRTRSGRSTVTSCATVPAKE